MQKIKLLFLVVLSATFYWACTEREFTSSPDAKLSFSSDTLSFDTVFTTIGSTTRYFKIYNRNDKFLKISNIRLDKGSESFFRLNVDGYQTNNLSDVEIAPNDSMYVFVEVTVDPQDKDNPIMVADQVVFDTNGNVQDVDLVAYGQDVHLVDGEIIETQTWTKGKPYLIRNSMLVDTLHTLTIEAGTKIHFTHNSTMYVLGSVQASGTKTDSVVFTSTRTEQLYDDVPGLWQGIWLLPGSKDNVFSNTVIKNAIVGIRVDSTMNNGHPTLQLHNSRIKHHTAVGLFAQGSEVFATNTVFGDCGVYSVSLQVGGDYNFLHCTVANYWAYSSRSTPSVIIRNYYIDVNEQEQLRPITAANFYNSIIYGNRENEILLDAHPDAEFSFRFANCLLRLDPEFEYSEFPQFSSCIVNEYPDFADTRTYDYRPKDTSPVLDKGNIEFVRPYPDLLQFDLKGDDRTVDVAPDLGVFEYEVIEEEK